MIDPEARKRLAGLMEQRRVNLRLTWRDVAEAGGISYEVLRAVRNGSAGIRPLTQAGIEDGLQWERGSLDRVLAGGDPVPVSAIPAPVVVAPAPPEPETPDPGDDVTGAVVAALFGPKERRVWAQVRRHLEATPAGRALFGDPAETAAWPPESADGFSGGAPFELTAAARRLLDATPPAELFRDPAEITVWGLNTLPYRKRVAMLVMYREPVRPQRAARRAGLREPGGLTA